MSFYCSNIFHIIALCVTTIAHADTQKCTQGAQIGTHAHIAQLVPSLLDSQHSPILQSSAKSSIVANDNTLYTTVIIYTALPKIYC